MCNLKTPISIFMLAALLTLGSFRAGATTCGDCWNSPKLPIASRVVIGLVYSAVISAIGIGGMGLGIFGTAQQANNHVGIPKGFSQATCLSNTGCRFSNATASLAAYCNWQCPSGHLACADQCAPHSLPNVEELCTCYKDTLRSQQYALSMGIIGTVMGSVMTTLGAVAALQFICGGYWQLKNLRTTSNQ